MARDDMEQVEEDRRWRQFTEWLRAEAERRAGTAYVDEWAVNLAPPDRRGAHLHVTRSDSGFATVETGFAVKAMAPFASEDDESHTAQAVVASIMEGRAWEYADAADDDTWIATRFFIPFPNGSQGSEAPRNPAVVRSFARRIPAWGELTSR